MCYTNLDVIETATRVVVRTVQIEDTVVIVDLNAKVNGLRSGKSKSALPTNS